MNKKLAKLKYLPNNFEIIGNGDYVVCSVSGKEIPLDELTYWNADFQARSVNNSTRTPGTFQARTVDNSTRTPAAYQRYDLSNNAVSA